MFNHVPILLVLSRRKIGRTLYVCTPLVLVFLCFLWPTTPTTPTKPLANRIIVLDPGHGGVDSGSNHAGLIEKDITLLISEIIAQQIALDGGVPILTRTTDTALWEIVTIHEEIEYTKVEFAQDKAAGRAIHPLDRHIVLGTRTPPRYRLGLRARLLVAEKNQAEVLLSIHTNHYQQESAKGVLTLYQTGSQQSLLLAQAIQKHLGPLLPGRPEPGIITDDFYLLRQSDIPAVIIEIGFISNTRDRTYMMSADGQLAIALAVSKGLQAYFTTQDNL